MESKNNSKSEVKKAAKGTGASPKRRQQSPITAPRKSVLSKLNSEKGNLKITLTTKRDKTAVKMVDVGVGDYAMVSTKDRGVGDGIIESDWLPKFPVTISHEECDSESSSEEWSHLKFPRKSSSKENSQPKKLKSRPKADKDRAKPKTKSRPKLVKQKTSKGKSKPATESNNDAGTQVEPPQVTKEKSDPFDDFPSVTKKKRFLPKVDCEICGKIYYKKYIARHMVSHTKKKPYSCKKCGKSFSDLYYYKQHVLHCTECSSAFQCEICHRNMASKQSLEEHIRLHSVVKLFQCHICAKGFRQAAALTSHLKTHGDRRPYSCDVCDSAFKSKVGLESHKAKSHQGIVKERFNCDQCEKSFASKTLLKYHTDQHMGVTRLKCEHCGKGFSRRDHLLKHVLIHENKKPFPCDVCGKGFRQNNDLKRHMTTHTGIKPFRCEACGQQFIHKVYLVRHKCPKASSASHDKDTSANAENQNPVLPNVEAPNNILSIPTSVSTAMPILYSDHMPMHPFLTSHDIFHTPYL